MKNTELEIARHIANRGSKALLDIEALVIKAKNMQEDESLSANYKVGFYSAIINQIYNKVIEGTESKFISNK
jgi:DNA-binding FadR family transcriptional regulator